MSSAIAFDSLAYVKKLKAVGIPEEQAEVHAETFTQIIEEKLATKVDLKKLEVSLKRDMKELETTLKRDMKELEILLKREMKDLELRLTIRLGAMMTAGIIIVATLVKLL